MKSTKLWSFTLAALLPFAFACEGYDKADVDEPEEVATTEEVPGAGDPDAPEAPETSEAVRDAIERYVRHDVEVKGAFLMLDPRTGEPLELTFDHVHEGVNPKGDDYVACVDFRDASGRLYDVDLVVDLEGEEAEVTDISLHKVDGQAVEAEGA